MRLDPATAGFAAGKPSGRGLLQGWIRLGDGADADPLALLAFLDAFPPVMFDLGRFGWSPTMELTAHVRALPAPGWIAVKVETRNIAGGMFEEDCELWDSTGRLVAQSRQLARQPRGLTAPTRGGEVRPSDVLGTVVRASCDGRLRFVTERGGRVSGEG